MSPAFSASGRPLPLLMGVLNVTPDSFSDGGRYAAPAAALAHGKRLMEEGCAILDIGGESTRPGAALLSPEDEQARVLPVIEGLREEAGKRGVIISVDTRNATTMEVAAAKGADMINDISALTHDPNALAVAAKLGLPVVLMHMKGAPPNMQKAPHYGDVLQEILDYLAARIGACEAAGIPREKLIADPGIGFGKTAEHNLILQHNITRFHELGVPVLVGASRKSFIGAVAGVENADDRLPGSLAAALFAAQHGVQILRVHDVAETRQALTIWRALQSPRLY